MKERTRNKIKSEKDKDGFTCETRWGGAGGFVAVRRRGDEEKWTATRFGHNSRGQVSQADEYIHCVDPPIGRTSHPRIIGPLKLLRKPH